MKGKYDLLLGMLVEREGKDIFQMMAWTFHHVYGATYNLMRTFDDGHKLTLSSGTQETDDKDVEFFRRCGQNRFGNTSLGTLCRDQPEEMFYIKCL